MVTAPGPAVRDTEVARARRIQLQAFLLKLHAAHTQLAEALLDGRVVLRRSHAAIEFAFAAERAATRALLFAQNQIEIESRRAAP